MNEGEELFAVMVAVVVFIYSNPPPSIFRFFALQALCFLFDFLLRVVSVSSLSSRHPIFISSSQTTFL